MNALLASVRNLDEARIALAGGCDWLDIKEPADGALGQAPLSVVGDIVVLAARRVPVSATIGDRWDRPASIADAVTDMAGTGVDYIKVGVRARAVGDATLAALRAACADERAVIAVCMAEAPPQADDLAALAVCGLRGIMLDTMDKQGPRLTGLMSVAALRAFVGEVQRLHLLAGLAGKLRATDIAGLAICGADYLGFRSALCAAGERRGNIDAQALATVRAALDGCAASHPINTSEVA